MMRALIRSCEVAVALVMLCASGAGGQTPVGFLPGLNESVYWWTPIGDSLSAEYNIAPFYPSYDPDAVFNTNRSALGALNSTTILVGHSAGGILARYKGQAQALDGVVTYGTPNYGAPLEENYPAFCSYVGEVLIHFGNLAWDLGWVWDSGWVIDDLQPYYHEVLDETLPGLCEGIAVSLNLPGYPAGAELIPSGPFIQDTLNAAANVASEESNVAHEASVFVTSTDYDDSGAFRIWLGDETGFIVGHSVKYLGVLAFAEYIGILDDHPNDPDWQQVAGDLYQMSYDLLEADNLWCETVSGSGLCYPNDEAVPSWSQVLGRGVEVDVTSGPIHTAEIQHSRGPLAEVFTLFGVQAVGGGGGGDSLSVSINGPANVKPGATCEWYATVADGTAPYTYHWTPGGYTGSDYDYTNGASDGGSFTMVLTVTDVNGRPGEASELVHVHSTAMECPF